MCRSWSTVEKIPRKGNMTSPGKTLTFARLSNLHITPTTLCNLYTLQIKSNNEHMVPCDMCGIHEGGGGGGGGLG